MAQKLNVPLPSKGLVVDRPGEYVDARSATNIKNMETNLAIIRKRSGTVAVGSSLGERIMRYFELQVGPLTRLFRAGISKVEVLNKSAGTWASVATAPLTGSAADSISYAFPLLAAVKTAVYTNGIDPIRKCSITGNDADLGGSPPKCKYMLAFGPYLLLGNITDDGAGDAFPFRVQWPDTGDPETWSGVNTNAGSVDLLDDPEDITGFGLFGNLPTVHKKKSIYVGQLLTTSDVFIFDRKATGVGAIAEATILTIPSGEQIFLASDGLHLFNGITAPLNDSPVQDELRGTMNAANAYKSQAIFLQELDEVWFCIPTGADTEPQTIYKYNWRTKDVYKDAMANLTALGISVDTADQTWADMTLSWSAATTRWNSASMLGLNPVAFFGDSSGNSTKRTPTSSDDAGVAVDSLWETKDFTAEDFGIPDIDRMMRWKGLQVWAKGGSVKVSYSLDGGTSWTLADTLTLAADYPDDDAPLPVYFDVVKSRLRLRFANNTAGESFTIKKYQLRADAREVSA